MSKAKRVISFGISIILTMMCVLPVCAVEESAPVTSAQMQALAEGLRDIEATKEMWNMENVDFNSLHIGSPIQTYDVRDNELVESNMLYPITYENELVLWAMPTGIQFQFSTGLVDEINEAVSTSDMFAIVYDRNNAFLCKNDEFIELLEFLDPVLDRGVLIPGEITNAEIITCASLADNANIQYGMAPRASTINSCNVSYVTQNPYDNLCWAATIACIANYKNGSNYSAYNIAVAKYGLYDYNKTLQNDQVITELGKYGIYYTGDVIDAPSSMTISSSISHDNPVYAVFDVLGENVDHVCTIYGINMNTTNHRITLMDPKTGPVLSVADEFGCFSYISTANNKQHELKGGFYRLSE